MLLKLSNVVLLFDVIGTILGFDELAEKMNRCINNLVLLWKNLHLKNNLLQECLQELTRHLSHFSVIFSKLEVDSILSDFELVDSSETMLSLLADVGFDPVRFDCFFALVVDEGTTQFETSAYIVVTFNGELR